MNRNFFFDVLVPPSNMTSSSINFEKTLDLDAAQDLHARMLLLCVYLEKDMARHVVLWTFSRQSATYRSSWTILKEGCCS
jgi:hypothetical protein